MKFRENWEFRDINYIIDPSSKWTCNFAAIDISTSLTLEWGLGSEELHLKTIKQVLAFSITAN